MGGERPRPLHGAGRFDPAPDQSANQSRNLEGVDGAASARMKPAAKMQVSGSRTIRAKVLRLREDLGVEHRRLGPGKNPVALFDLLVGEAGFNRSLSQNDRVVRPAPQRL